MPLTTPDVQEKRANMKKRADEYVEATRQSSSGKGDRGLQSAPAELGPPRRKFTTDTPLAKQSLATDLVFGGSAIPASQDLPESFELDIKAPMRAIRHQDDDDIVPERQSELPGINSLDVVAEEGEKQEAEAGAGQRQLSEAEAEAEAAREGWGESFKVEWLCLERLPFYRTRNLRNPWNHDREIKVSRDGTELEPSVGQKLLDEWQTMASEPAAETDRATAGPSKRAATSAPPLTQPVHLAAKDSPAGRGGTRRP